MKLIFEYLKTERKAVFLPVLEIGALIVVLRLCAVETEITLYAAAIAFFFGAVWLLCGFYIFRRKHLRLSALLHQADLQNDDFEEANLLMEKDWRAIVLRLIEEKREILTKTDEKTKDMMDYYTLWAHQIKTPIAAMTLKLQNTSPQDPELNEALTQIEQYVEMVLSYLRLDSGSTDYLIRRYDLDGIVKQAVRKYASQFIRKKIRLLYSPLTAEVLTDEKWLLFVIEQVLSNAVKYTENGQISITEENQTLIIRDTGIGIAPEDLPRIFENGYTGYNGRKDKKASGLGLYLCRRICGNLGHAIQAFSDESGTEIRIGLSSTELPPQ